MNPFDALTEYDKGGISRYIHMYGNISYEHDTDFDRLRKALNGWNAAKQFLFDNVFDRQLRVRIPVHITTERLEVLESLKTVYHVPHILKSEHAIHDFLLTHIPDKQGDRFIYGVLSHIEYMHIDTTLSQDECNNVACVFCRLLRYSNVAENRVLESLEYTYFNARSDKKKNVSVCVGTKTMHAIRTLLGHIGYTDMAAFDEWRAKISAVTTIKESQVTLVLSIHPIDYMMMSDNDCGWRTCMKWQDGSSSLGTIEMMNSTSAIVGYIENSQYPTCNRCGYDFPNKAWRCMFYVTDEIILAGKPYPYYSRQLCTAGIDILKSMVGDTFGHEYTDVCEYEDMSWYYDNYDEECIGDTAVIMNASTQDNWKFFDYDTEDEIADEFNDRVLVATGYFMYNDMYEDDTCTYLCAKSRSLSGMRQVDLSGQCTCMCCGGPIYNSDSDETEKYCNKCYNKYACEDGMLHPDEDIYSFTMFDEPNATMTLEIAMSNVVWSPYRNMFIRKDKKQYTYVNVYYADNIHVDDIVYDNNVGIFRTMLSTIKSMCVLSDDKIALRYSKDEANMYINTMYAVTSDVDWFLENIRKFNETEAVNLDDEKQHKRAILLSE